MTTKDELLAQLRRIRSHDVPWREGRTFAGVYDPGAVAADAAAAAYAEFSSENALYVNFYPSLLQLEAEVLARVKTLVRAPDGACGNLTSGGTESILLACKAARDSAAAERGVRNGEIVLARSAHPAFHKAAHLLGLRVVITEFDAGFRADAAAMAAAITPRTVMLVASAPCYSHGVVDPVPALAQLAQRHSLWLHVDGCVGALFMGFMREAAMPVPPFDFSIDGVSSISADLHKYGYAPKGAGSLVYCSRGLRRHALYANAHTSGYALVNPTALSSRSGGPIAAAWATLQVLGDDGYRRIVQQTMAATAQLRAGIAAIDGLSVLGEPAMCMFALACRDASVFEIEDQMRERGWHLQSQFSAPGTPANLHFSINHNNVPHVAALLADLRASVEAARRVPVPDVQPLVRLVLDALREPGAFDIDRLLGAVGASSGRLPQRWALINTLLDALPDSAVDALLVEYANRLYA